MSHIADEILERYDLNLIWHEPELTTLEQHLLWCQDCITRAEATHQYVHVMRLALLRSDD
jgi:hypothetical protein